MKKKYLLLGLAALLTIGAVSCGKDKKCRCAVLHSSKVRIITITKGNCEDLKLFRYHTALDSLKVDSLLCTDYEFKIDADL